MGFWNGFLASDRIWVDWFDRNSKLILNAYSNSNPPLPSPCVKYPFAANEELIELCLESLFKHSAPQKYPLIPHQAAIEHFEIACDSIDNHLDGILAFFTNRSTNAHAESFKAQIKLFRANLRGVNNQKIFLYRLQKVFAWIYSLPRKIPWPTVMRENIVVVCRNHYGDICRK